MIRHAISLGDLRKRIRELAPTWFQDAEAVLRQLPSTPTSDDFEPLWSLIKSIYIGIQCSKCCFCEKPLEGNIEQDVEHFRPKTEVRPWNPPTRLVQAGVAVNQPSAPKPEPGYTQLAYHPLNYAMACKFCNSTLKRNYFPIAGTRRSGGTNPASMKQEKAYLIYPLGDHDDKGL